MIYYINGQIEEININQFVTDTEYYEYIMNKLKN